MSSRPIKLADVAASRANNFDVLRLFAAALVLVSHAFPLTGHRDLLFHIDLGTIGVEIFFAVSGFLVMKSWLSEPRVRTFLRKRALRIFPGLVCALAVATLVIGPFFSALPVAEYFSSPNSWLYFVRNVLLEPQWRLPGVFTGNPSTAVNGSLWTLPVEVQMYVLLAVAGVTGFARRRLPVVICAAALAFLNLVTIPGPSMRLASVFVAGAALYLLRGAIVLRAEIAIALFVAWAALSETRFEAAVAMIAIPYLVTWAAYCSPAGLRRLVAPGDVSYGFYVYAFPVQQSVVALLGPLNPWLLIAIAMPAAWMLGLCSWRLVEAPMLKRKQVTPVRRDERSATSAVLSSP